MSGILSDNLGRAGGLMKAVAAGGDIVLLGTLTPSGASTADFTSSHFDNSTYHYYTVRFELNVGTDNVQIYVRTSSDGGSSYDSGSSDYKYVGDRTYSTGTAAPFGDTQGYYRITAGTVGNAANEFIAGEIIISDATTTEFTTMVSRTASYDQSNAVQLHMVAGFRESAADVDGVQFLASSGTITGNLKLYGMK